ncbi:MAG TPA: S41 family peptidase [Deinococcales bacterium]|nr:S41 family peptidase [Deinococcales bacterium]
MIQLSKLAVAAILAVAPVALASPAQDLFDQGSFFLQFDYFGYSTVSVKDLTDKYQAQLDTACATQKDTCPYTVAADILTKMTADLKDGHTYYLTPDEYAQETGQIRGGSNPSPGPRIGVTTQRIPGSPDRRVITVLPGSPAEKAGLQRGDRIVGVNGAPLPDSDQDNASAITKLVATGKPLTVNIKRNQDNVENALTLNLTLTGQVVDLANVSTLTKLNATTGLLKIPEFSGGTGEKVNELVVSAQKQGLTSLIVDLRDDPGGVECQQAVYPFVGDLTRERADRRGVTYDIVRNGATYQRDASGREVQVDALDTVARWTGKLAVLVNGESGSCSELFASDVQYAKSGVIVGEPTYGVGNTGTELVPLIDGSALAITSRRTLRANGTPYPDKVTPDIQLPGGADEFLKTGFDRELERALQEVSAA